LSQPELFKLLLLESLERAFRWSYLPDRLVSSPVGPNVDPPDPQAKGQRMKDLLPIYKNRRQL
jgi:hypothetical protein